MEGCTNDVLKLHSATQAMHSAPKLEVRNQLNLHETTAASTLHHAQA
jgi:hypothetical protein